MKQSWVIFIISFYIIMQFLVSIGARDITPISSGTTTTLGLMTVVRGTDSGFLTLITNGWSVISNFVNAIFLYNPVVWAGGWASFYYIVILPFSISFIITIVALLRGVGSS